MTSNWSLFDTITQNYWTWILLVIKIIISNQNNYSTRHFTPTNFLNAPHMRTCEQKRKKTCGHSSKTWPDWAKPMWFLDSAHQIRSKSAKKHRQQICCWPVLSTINMYTFYFLSTKNTRILGCTTWTLTKRLEKKLDGNYTRILRAILNKSWQQHPTRHQLYGHLPPITKTIQVRRTRHAGHCWRSRDELIRDVLLWIPTHGRAKAGRPARTYIQQLCEDTGCCPEDLPRAMNDREEWRERVRDIRAASTIWWWWWNFVQLKGYYYALFTISPINWHTLNFYNFLVEKVNFPLKQMHQDFIISGGKLYNQYEYYKQICE